MYPYEQLASEYPWIPINYRPMPHHLPGLTMYGVIYLDRHATAVKKYETLQEEIAHYDTTVGDIATVDTKDSRKQEKKARSLAMERAVPLDDLIFCYNHGIWDPEDIADYCNVDVDYLHKALDSYREKRGLIFNYKNYRFDLRNGIHIFKLRRRLNEYF